MTPLEAALLFLAMALPPFWWVHRKLAQDSDPAYLRTQGVVIVLEKAIEAHSAAIGEFMGHPVWETVTFKGLLYRFDHVIAPKRRETIEPGQLYLEPGLVYVVQ